MSLCSPHYLWGQNLIIIYAKFDLAERIYSHEMNVKITSYNMIKIKFVEIQKKFWYINTISEMTSSLGMRDISWKKRCQFKHLSTKSIFATCQKVGRKLKYVNNIKRILKFLYFWTTIFVLIVAFASFQTLYNAALFMCLSFSVSFSEFWTQHFIQSIGIECSHFAFHD